MTLKEGDEQTTSFLRINLKQRNPHAMSNVNRRIAVIRTLMRLWQVRIDARYSPRQLDKLTLRVIVLS